MSKTAASSSSVSKAIGQLASQLEYDLIPLSVDDGITRYLNQKRSEIAQSTYESYEKKLARFVTFSESRVIDDLNELNGRIIDDYDSWLRHEASDEVEELSAKTMRDEMYLFRDFIEYLETIDAVQPGLHLNVPIPDPDEVKGSRDVDLDPERVEQILTHLETFNFASLSHVIWVLAARVGRRTGGCIGLDLDNVYLDVDEPYLEFEHDPPKTTLKNGSDSEGQVAITEDEADILRQYIENVRPAIVEEDGREPLLASEYGRIAKSTFRRHIYKWTRPCKIEGSCPHEKDPDTCEAAASADTAAQCASVRSPHAVRHGFISQGRRVGIPIEVLSDRCDVSPEEIKSTYDESTEEERRQVRRQVLDEYSEGSSGGYL